MRRCNADLAMAGALAVLGGAMARGSVSYGLFAEAGRIGPGFMPFVAGLALVTFSVWTCVEVIVRARGARQPEAASARTTGDRAAGDGSTSGQGDERQPSAAAGAQPRRTERKVVLVVLLTAGAAVLAPVTGFLAAFGLLILVLLAAVEREPLWLAATVSVVAVTVSWLVFAQLLGIPLPGGVLGLLGGG